MEPGDLVICKLDKGNYAGESSVREYLTWSELRSKILSGEVCVILETEGKNHLSEVRRIKILDSEGKVDWVFSHHFLKVPT